MSFFVDTSALFALLSADDLNHSKAKRSWLDLLTREEELVTTNYVLVETFALVQRRLGMEAVRILSEEILPVLEIEWIDETKHVEAVKKLIVTSKREISLVDHASFETMRRLEIKSAFAFDDDFAKQGFECIP
ncbi:MAG: PIN domain-containing protein [Chloroflexi bacterium]|nr:PIN domain-containing protein [Chloroflexota bacterium]